VVVESEGSSVNSDDISKSLNNGEIFESLGVQNQGSVVAGISASLLALDIETWVNNLKGANVSVLIGLVGESSIDNNSIEVLSI
jgi:hypothetical protein